ncbi:MAG TPA: dTDP-4-dehydrorhamnose 3,5-epimerase family protein, partial [Gaiellaceae bacterium]|nr:dTDP-4-dehydrorhamnose 3,5-epimerase family protein [Gaiellaceae bacterium]
MIEGLVRIPLCVFEDERGWFVELRRESSLPKPTRQTNLSFSRQGVIRGLHYHERGQDDLFACLQGRARVVVLDRSTGETYTEDIGDGNPVALYIPGIHAHGFEALTDLLFLYHVTEEYD